jgi:hypothetical protein
MRARFQPCWQPKETKPPGGIAPFPTPTTYISRALRVRTMPLQLFRSPAIAGEAAASSRATCSPRVQRTAARSPVVRAFNNSRLPPDTPKEELPARGREWLATILSRFGPVKDKAQNTATLEFEKPLLELDKRIREVSVGSATHSTRPHRCQHLHAQPGKRPCLRIVWNAGEEGGRGERCRRLCVYQGARAAGYAGMCTGCVTAGLQCVVTCMLLRATDFGPVHCSAPVSAEARADGFGRVAATSLPPNTPPPHRSCAGRPTAG